MGLAERRAIKAFQDTLYPALEARVHDAACFALPLEVDWASLTFESYAHLYNEALPKLYFEPLIAALKKITIDDMGREALKAGVTKVVIKGTDSYSSWWAELEGKVLTLTYAFTNVDDVDARTDVLLKKLESAL